MKSLSKYLITAALACAIAVGSTWWLLDKKYDRDLAEIENSYNAEITEINNAKDSVQNAFDSVTVVLRAYEAELATLNKKEAQHKAEIDHLETELKKVLNWFFDATVDDNYKYLQDRYPTEDSLTYPFAGNQVKSMAMAIVEGDYKDSIISEMDSLQLILRAKLMTSSAMISSLYRERNEFELLTTKLYTNLAIMAQEKKISQEEEARLRKALNKWRMGGLGGLGFAALVLILL